MILNDPKEKCHEVVLPPWCMTQIECTYGAKKTFLISSECLKYVQFTPCIQGVTIFIIFRLSNCKWARKYFEPAVLIILMLQTKTITA